MFKHANTFFPGDPVAKVLADGTKVAGKQTGHITDANPDTGRVKVAWASGEEEWCNAAELTKT